MKKIFSTLICLFFLTAFSQNQTFNGLKTFNVPPKFKSVGQNDLNTKLLSINSSDQLQWVDKSSISPLTPTFQQVTDAGSITSNDITVSSLLKIQRANSSGHYIGRRAELTGSGVALGEEAGYQSTNSGNSVFIGDSAGELSSDQSSSVFIGNSTGAASSGFGANTAVGNGAFTSSTGSYNTMIGYNSGSSVTGDHLIGIGPSALSFVSGKSRVIHLNCGSSPATTVSTANDQFIISTFNKAIRFNMPIDNDYEFNYTLSSGTIPSLKQIAPASSSTGVVGEIRVVSGFVYFCVSANTWQRAILLTY